MNKLQMAHQMAIAIQSTEPMTDMVLLSSLCFSYADAMFAEVEKRKDKTLPDVLWQPDWSLAPDWAKWWAMDKDGDANWYALKPFVGVDYFQNQDSSAEHRAFLGTLNFGYTGDWRDSLRMRPKGV